MPRVVNKPKVIWMVNDFGGYVRICDLYLWIKFSNETDELQFSIEEPNLYKKLRDGNFPIPVHKGVTIIRSETSDEAEETVEIVLHRPGIDNYKAIVAIEEILLELCYFKSLRESGG